MEKGNDEWETPDDLYNSLDGEYHFVLDAAASPINNKCPSYFGLGGVASDALTADWQPYLKMGNIWLNPPYSRGLQRKFIEKVIAEKRQYEEDESNAFALDGGMWEVVCLLPADTSTRLFHELVVPNAAITFLKGRLRFKGALQCAKFGSLLAVF